MKLNLPADRMKRIVNNYGVYFALFVIVITASVVYENFLSYTNITNVLKQNCAKSIVAIGATMVILTGGRDLSVGSGVALSGILTAYFSDSGLLVMIAVPLMVGILIGVINGFCVAKLKIASYIVTLAMMMAVRGCVYIISNEHTISFSARGKVLSEFVNGNVFGVLPVQVIIMALAYVIAGWVLHQTNFGRSVYAVGGSEDASNYMGLKTVKTKFMVYVISGFCAALAGILLSARLSSGQPYVATTWQMDAIAAVAIGGASVSGGYGRISGTLAGVMVLGLISNIINLQGTLSSWWQNIINGAILLVVIIIQTQLSRQGRGGK